ncbi:hypothetical protein STENM327S_05453 [Streptomyces tendae]
MGRPIASLQPSVNCEPHCAPVAGSLAIWMTSKQISSAH